jgi:hypothetical protein
MKTGQRLVRALALGLMLALVAGLALAQDSEPRAGVAAPSALGTAFTYQGRLEATGGPVNATCDLRFKLFNAGSDGTQIDGTKTLSGVQISEGLFTVQLDFGAGAFDGRPRWLEIEVSCPAGVGEYATLSPRQLLTPAPYALYAADAPDTLEGLSCASGQVAKWNGSAWLCADDKTGDGGAHDHWGQTWSGSGTGLTLNSSDSDGLHVSSGLDGVHVGDAGKDGVYVNRAGQCSPRPNDSQNGIEVACAKVHGLWVGEAVDGVTVSDAGVDGVDVHKAGNMGVRVAQAGVVGVMVQVVGSAAAANFSDGRNGFEVAGAQDHGLYVGWAGQTGVLVEESAWNGVVIEKAGGDGVRATGTTYNALYGDTAKANGEWGVYTPDKIRGSNVTFNTLSLIAQVTGPEPLTGGDVVAAQGVAPPLRRGDAAVPLVRLAGAGGGVVGVVEGRMVLMDIPSPEGVEVPARAPELRSAEGPARAGDYVALTVLGVAQVKVGAEAGIPAGTRLTAGDRGLARALETVVVDGVTLAESAPSLGITLDEPDGDGFVWVLVNPQ